MSNVGTKLVHLMSRFHYRLRILIFLLLGSLYYISLSKNLSIYSSVSRNHLVSKQSRDLSCSNQQLDRLKKHFLLFNARVLSKESKCPQSLWLDDILALGMEAKSRTLTGISVGCNSAMDAIGSSRALSRNPIFSKSTWLSSIEKVSTRKIIAACRTAKTKEEGLHADLDEVELNSSSLPMRIEFHCIEPLAATFDTIQKSSKELGLAKHGFHIHRYVISNSTGSVPFPKGKVGKESFGVPSCQQNTSDNPVGECEYVTMLTLDSFVSMHLYNKQIIDMLFIDTEGFDWRVLRQGRATLERTRYLEFEYHSAWADDEMLKDAVAYLEDLDFVCYFAGIGKLLKLTHGCWTDLYEIRRWSNIACVRVSEISWVDIMEAYFNKTLYLSKK
jgi:FkbM family methyltransferase